MFQKSYCCVILVVLTQIVACSQKTNVPQVKAIAISGDPLSFIQNTTLNTHEGLPMEMFADKKEWQFYGHMIYTKKQEVVNDQAQLEKENRPLNDNDLKTKKAVNTYVMKGLKNSIYGQDVVFESTIKSYLQFRFTRKGAQLFLKDVAAYKNLKLRSSEFKVQHYSVRKDRQVFSILLSMDGTIDPAIRGGRTLLALYFIKKKSDVVLGTLLNKAYNYIFGPGVKVAWPQDKALSMTVCEDVGASYYYAQSAVRGIDEWSRPLDKRLQLESHEQFERCPPFSDVNTQTINHVTDWIELEGRKAMTQAITFSIPDFFQSRIVDSDIFVFEAEWNENISPHQLSDTEVYQNPKIQDLYHWMISHEMGHVLGLHHIFDGTPSIMSYRQHNGIHTYDINAVQALYPLERPKTKDPIDTWETIKAKFLTTYSSGR